jgi:hypothetical protein
VAALATTMTMTKVMEVVGGTDNNQLKASASDGNGNDNDGGNDDGGGGCGSDGGGW